MDAYLLPPHVFVCRNGDHIVFLDLKRDRYQALSAKHARGLAARIAGWPQLLPTSADEASSVAPQEEQVNQLLEKLRQQGLLTVDLRAGKPVSTPALAAPTQALNADHLAIPPIGLLDVLRFLRACTVAAVLVKRTSLERIVARAQRRKLRQKNAPLDLKRLGELIGIFARLRPLVFTARNACLFEALALGEFLTARGIVPTWVFGVQANPFMAHCWLQLGDTVLNDEVVYVRGLTPIIAT